MADDHGVCHSSRVKRWTKCRQNDTLTPYMALILPIFTPKYAFFGKIECFFRKMVITLHIRLLPKPAFTWGAPHADGGRRQVIVNTIQEKRRLLDALFLTAWNLANSMIMSGTQQRQMFMVARIASSRLWGVLYILLSVGFGVARSTLSGNARASCSGTSNRYVPTLF